MGLYKWLQHKDVAGDAVLSFSAQVDAHDCNLYIFTPQGPRELLFKM